MPLTNPPAAGGSSSTLGFYGTAPVAKTTGFVNTYATADKTLSAYTPNVQTTPFAGTGTASLTDLLALQVAYENLRLFAEDLAQQHNSLITALKATGLIA